LLAVFRLSILNTSLLFSNTILINNQLGVILSGGPYSVYENGSPHVDPAVWDLNVPVLGICYGLQVI
jgi:GMP synthase-like glutamine amidotransferase